jgi:hypothetical protein
MSVGKGLTRDSLSRRPEDPGYVVAYKLKYGFEKGLVSEESMSYAEAEKKAAELGAQDPEKVFWPEMHEDLPQ